MNEINETLRFASRQAFIIRSITIVLFAYGAYLVVRQFNRGKLQPLRWRLLAMIGFNGISNLPILWIHWQRMYGRTVSPEFSAFAANSNSLAMLFTAILIISIIRFRIKN